MTSRRRRRIAMLTSEEVREIEADATKLRDSMRRALMRLVPFNQSYSALYKLGDEIRIALNVISGRPADHAEPLFGPGAMPPDPERQARLEEE
jgi:hypothetical protein